MSRISLSFLSISVLILFGFLELGLNSKASAEIVKAKPGDDFVERIQGMAHLHHTQSSYTVNWDVMKDHLGELGIRYLRRVHTSRLSQPDNIARHHYLYNNYGIRFQFQVRQGFLKKKGIWSKEQLRHNLEIIQHDFPLEMIVRLEGPNEGPFETEEQRYAIINYQTELYKSVKTDSLLNQIPVVCFSTIDLGGLDLFDNLHRICDIGNIHSYPGSRTPDGFVNHIQRRFLGSKAYPTKKDMAITEQAYGDRGVQFPDTMHRNSNIQAKYEQRMLLLQYEKDLKIIGRSQLADAKPDGVNNKFSYIGYLKYDGSPKPVYYAVKNLLSLLGEAEWNQDCQKWSYPPDFIPDSLNYEIEGNKKNIKQLLFQKSDKRFFLVLWQEVNSWDNVSGTEREISIRNLTLKLDVPMDLARIWQPYNPDKPALEMTPISTSKYPKNLSLSVPDHPIVVELVPRKLDIK